MLKVSQKVIKVIKKAECLEGISRNKFKTKGIEFPFWGTKVVKID